MISQGKYVICAALLLGAASQGQLTAQASAPPSPGNKPVQIFVTASGKDATPDLPPLSDLSVTIDKKTAQVSSLRAARQDKLLFALLVDTSTSQSNEASAVKEAAWQIFKALSTNGNQGYLVFFSDDFVISRTTLQPSVARDVLDQMTFGGGTALYDAIGDTCKNALSRSANPDAPRRAIILLSDGHENASQLARGQVEGIAEQEGVAIFSLSPPHSDDSRGQHILEEASQKTGGQSIIAKTLADGVKPLVDAIEAQWSLFLVPPSAPDKKLHSLSVKTSEKKIKISAPALIPLE